MFRRFQAGSLLGFPIELSPGFLLLLLIAFVWRGGMTGLLFLGVTMISVLLHELGHAVTARKLGVRIGSIELNFFGGAAKMLEMPKSANHEALIAIAGPIVSLLLVGAFVTARYVVGLQNELALTAIPSGTAIGAWLAQGNDLVHFLGIAALINLVLAVFNLLPVLPMDGGRVFRALLTRKYDFVAATQSAVRFGRYILVAIGIFAAYNGAWTLLFLVAYLWMLGAMEIMQAHVTASRMTYDKQGYRERPASPHGGEWDPNSAAGNPMFSIFEAMMRNAAAQQAAQGRVHPEEVSDTDVPPRRARGTTGSGPVSEALRKAPHVIVEKP